MRGSVSFFCFFVDKVLNLVVELVENLVEKDGESDQCLTLDFVLLV